MDKITKTNSEILWDYNKLNPKQILPEQADAIIALGCKDLGVAERAAAVYHSVQTDRLVFSGECGQFTKGYFTQTEAETFAEVARANGVPDKAIYLEKRARNTGENIHYSQQLLERLGHSALRSVVLVQRPFMERRIKATFEAQWQGAEQVAVTTTSENLDLAQYIQTKRLDERYVVSLLVDTTKRIIDYPARGFQTEQALPTEVSEAYCTLVERGYGSSLPAVAIDAAQVPTA